MPGRWIEISAFYIDEFEVTVDGYVACVDAGDCQPTPGEPDCNATFVDRGNHPINCLTWGDANTYCTAQGKRLPTEAEWERAARGDELRLYPWGDALPSCTLAAVSDESGDGCGADSTLPVGSRRDGDSPFGVADMSGNVTEWVFDLYSQTYYADSPDVDPQGPTDGTNRSLRGSAFTVGYDWTAAHRVSKRLGSPPDSYLSITGVRCAAVAG